MIAISWAYFVDCSRKRSPLVSDHFLVNQKWSLTTELTVYVFNVLAQGYKWSMDINETHINN